jgi:hypothetical protein
VIVDRPTRLIERGSPAAMLRERTFAVIRDGLRPRRSDESGESGISRLDARIAAREAGTVNLLFITTHNGIRIAELGMAAGAVGAAVLAVGAMTPLGRRGGTVVGGWLIAAGFLLLIVATHWGNFH